MPIRRRRITEPVLRREYLEQGWSIERIAKHHRTSNQTVISYLKEYGIEHRHHGGRRKIEIPEEDLRALAEDEGMSIRDMARTLSVSTATIQRHLNKYGIKTNKATPEARPRESSSVENIKALREQDVSVMEIARRCGVSPGRIHDICKRHGLY